MTERSIEKASGVVIQRGASHDASLLLALRSLPPNAIVIDPTAPETLAALAGALADARPAIRAWILAEFASGEAQAGLAAVQAILPAFFARLRSKP
jgi:hypothetical protein